MNTEAFNIGPVPALLWGAPSERVIVAVHGNMSHKADTVIRLLAGEAAACGYQVLSFDLPEHGARQGESTLCKVQVCVPELREVMAYAAKRWEEVGLFGCSLGAYFSLLAYRDLALSRCLLLSPVVDMELLIDSMMAWSDITPDRLKECGQIRSPVGQMLYWDYYCYVKEHPVDRWETPTHILYGEHDNLSDRGAVEAFSQRFGCDLEIAAGAEHFFHTGQQLDLFGDWLSRRLKH